ncbi:MAG: ligase-associated DNA damage response endonuclease PdeM [Acidobacteriota bacterium]|nr:ligase-associated DNA damage response endonuclease PdeM [Acidobacteriota bacterium]
MKVEVAGALLELLPERAAWWAEKSTLFLADTHWGKAATLRAHGMPIPMGTTTDDLARLSAAVHRTGCRRIVLLGDAIHAREGRAARTLGAVADWRARHADVEILLVRGNHDRGAGDPPAELRIECVNAPVFEAPFAFQHHPNKAVRGYALAGHTHPAIRLRGKAMQRATLPCFWFTAEVATLPAFGSFCGAALISPASGDRVYAIAGDEIVQIPGI